MLIILLGEFICYIDSDDYIENNYVEKLYEQCITANADISVCGRCYVQEDGTILLKSEVTKKVINKKEALKELFDEKYILPSSCDKMYKKEVLKKCKFDENKKIGEDFDYLYQAIINSEIISINTEENLYNYVKRQGSAMNSKADIKEWKKELELCEQIIKDTQKNFPNIYKFAIKRYVRVCIDIIYITILENDDKTMIEIINNMKKYKNNVYYKWNFKYKIRLFIILTFPKIWKHYVKSK